MIPALLNSIQITVYGKIYKFVAEFMTEFENHKTITEHNSELFKKLTFFYFINYNASLFYIAFFKGSIEGCVDPLSSSEFCGLELAYQVANVFVVNDFLTRFVNSLVTPAVTRFFARRQASRDKTMDFATMGPIEHQFRVLALYDPTRELVLDYIELYIQWGYLTLFGSACPIVIALACFTNYVETRADGYKLFHDYRRVIPNRVDGIGEPLQVFQWTVYLAVPVNAGLIVYCFGAVRWLPKSSYIWVFVLLMIAMALLMMRLETIFPDVPRATRVQLARQKVVYEKIVLGIADEEEDNGEEGEDGGAGAAERLDFDDSMIGLSVEQVKARAQAGSPHHEREPPTVKSTVVPLSKVNLSYSGTKGRRGRARHGGVNPAAESAGGSRAPGRSASGASTTKKKKDRSLKPT